MQIISEIDQLMFSLAEERKPGKMIGLVPTMGFLHEGHLSLVRKSVNITDCTVVSIFVNPTQFSPNEDFSQYPRDMQRDLSLLEKEGVDYVFTPSMADIYPQGFRTYVEIHDLQDRLCGISRPIFFRGIATVVLKLLNIVQPDVAFFGQKDAQQAIILKRMVKDLNLRARIEVLPIARDEEGLALSSRNAYFNAEQKKAALCLYRSLCRAKQMIAGGERDPKKIKEEMSAIIDSQPKAGIDYIAIVNPNDLNPISRIEKGTLIAMAVFIDKIRLIDNIIV